MNYKWITIDRRTLQVSFVSEQPSEGLYVQTARGHQQTAAIKRFAEGALLDVLEKLERQSIDEPTEEQVAFCLPTPDPWLIVLGMIMWEGIVQGASWDVVKTLVSKALKKMQGEGLAPKSTSDAESEVEAQLGFAWVGYDAGRKRKEVFFGLKMKYDNKRKPKRPRKKTSEGRSKNARSARSL